MDTVLAHYIRIKVFTERGVESQSKVEIPYFNRTRIKDIAGRTIKPDGTIIELKKDGIFESTIAKADRLKLQAKSFVMPGVVPGAIIEYRWREIRPSFLYARFQLQRDIPLQSVKYFIKPGPYWSLGMRSVVFNGPQAPLQKERNGFYSVTMTNVPAFREEPRMPPGDYVRRWLLLFYSESDTNLEPQKFWNKYGKDVYEKNKASMKVSDEVRKAAAEATSGATTSEEKLKRLFDFCRSKIRRIDDDASGLTDSDREKMKENKSPADTLKRGYGTGNDINMLFAALASAAGFDARIARLGDRSDFFFNPTFTDDYFLHSYNIAVKVDNQWRFFDPANTYVPFGMLRWQEEGEQALISDPKEPVFIQTPLSPAEKSVERRTAKLRLSEDGTLEGEVRIEYTGHLAADRKEYNDDDSPQQREETLREMEKNRLSTAELSEIRIENVTDPDKPFVYAYRVRVPGYAQRTGRRLFLQSAFFQRGIGPLFPTSERKYDIYFHYPWMKEDVVTIELPAGFTLDNAESPGSFSMGEVGHYNVSVGVTQDQKMLVYKRNFKFSGLLFPVSGYSQLKRVFDELHKQDNHTITLRQSAASTPN